ncbi:MULTISPECIES: hypothetical protein [unclassified Enterococcus]|uniref:hypothetical protein n=1 Tax=unclassified Enterococcus TaxID=2608891 RepID=UPI000A33282C|nr:MULTISPECIES: hypothetical protein [unclassified Enterococcus]OTO67697.1 hypothetical protein A5865_003376 [Enterococcus sp. 12E11_DIV0728]OUZ15639.1 hypothetical protein A5868_000550 [Enterococcus sp. 12F9_DIV0723]
MDVKKLGTRQLFLMKRESLEKKIETYYEQSDDADSVIEYLVAVMVRNALNLTGAFSFLCKDLLRDLVLTVEPTDTLRLFLPLFKEYFESKEWEGLIKQYFGSPSEYFAQTESIRSFKNAFERQGSLDLYREGLVYDIRSRFEDAAGKRHLLTIRDVDPNKEETLVAEILEVLTLLSIFEVDGVRKFVALVDYKGGGHVETTSYKVGKAKQTEEDTVVEEAPKNTKTEKQPVLAAAASPSPKKANKLSYEEAAAIVEAEYPLPGEEASSTESPSHNAVDLPPKPKSSHVRFDKTPEQVEEEHRQKNLKRRLDKQQGKKKDSRTKRNRKRK